MANSNFIKDFNGNKLKSYIVSDDNKTEYKTMKSLATEMGVDNTTLNKQVNNNRMPLFNYNFICKLLNVPKRTFLNSVEQPISQTDMTPTTVMVNTDELNKLVDSIGKLVSNLNTNVFILTKSLGEVNEKLEYINRNVCDLVDYATEPTERDKKVV